MFALEGAQLDLFVIREYADAMKIMKKSHLARSNHSRYIQCERDVMTRVDHPFVITLLCCFQSPEKLFLVMEYAAGGELFQHPSGAAGRGRENYIFKKHLFKNIYSNEWAVAGRR